MATELWLHAVVVGGLALAAGSAAWGLGQLLAALGRSAFTRRKAWIDRTLERYRVRIPKPDVWPEERAARGRGVTPWLFALGAGALAVKALFGGSFLIALVLGALAIAGQRYLASRTTHRARRAELTTAVGELVEAFRSAYLVENAIFPALAATLPQVHSPLLAGALAQAVQIFRAGRPSGQVLAPLHALRDAYLDQLAFILERAPDAEPAVVAAALEDLTRRLAERRRIAGRLRVAMASVNGTVRFLEAVNLAALVAVVVLPFWWTYYAAHPLFLLTGLALALGATVYFDLRVQQLDEMTL